MKKRLVIGTCLAANLLWLACHSTIPPYNVSRPLEELDWLKAIVDDASWRPNQSIHVDQATYKGRTVYQVENRMAIETRLYQ